MTGSGRPAALDQLPAGPGIYALLDRADRILYIGRAADLRQRVRSYWSPSLDRPGLLKMTRHVRRVFITRTASEHEAAFLERVLLECHDPLFNRTTGVESVVAIRLC